MTTVPLTCFVCNLVMRRFKGSAEQGRAACRDCKSTPAAIKHGTAYAYKKRGCRCADCTAAATAQNAEYVARARCRDGVSPSARSKREARGRDGSASIACVFCKLPLVNVRSAASKAPMHKACRSVAPNWMVSGGVGPRKAAVLKALDRAASGTSGGNRVYVNGACAWCGDDFTSPNGRFCSDKCKVSSKYRRRSSGRSFCPSPSERLSIYERDLWACQLCGNPTARGSEWGFSWRPTLDHIVPQSKMAVPDHSPSNLRLVHSWCNSARGDGSNMTEIDLVVRAREMFRGVYLVSV